MLLRAERSGDFLLQQHCLEQMLPYFFAPGHQNYARYISWYLRQIEHILQEGKTDLLAGAHVCRHSDGGTAVPGDQFGEQTYIRSGKGAGGMNGIPTRPEQVAVWVNSFIMCAHMDIAMDEMYEIIEKVEQESIGTSEGKTLHKEERGNRKKTDESDRRKLAIELEKYSHPLNDKHPSLHNICNGHVSPDTVNVHDALSIGSEQSKAFSSSLGSTYTFHTAIKKES